MLDAEVNDQALAFLINKVHSKQYWVMGIGFFLRAA